MIGKPVGWGSQWSFGRGDLVQVLQVIPLAGYGVGEEEVRVDGGEFARFGGN